MVHCKSLSPELRKLAVHIEGIALDVGLDFYDVVFERFAGRDVNALAAYGGFPIRYPSWRFGMEYERLDKGYSWGLSKIYELVINNDPTYAYLVGSNSLMEQKLVMAHVFGHADFFKHNIWFKPTERKMLDAMASNAERIRRYIEAVGLEEVERFQDLVLALDNLIDPFQPLREMRSGAKGGRGASQGLAERAKLSFEATLGGDVLRAEPAGSLSNGKLPTYDVLGFLCEHAPLEPWQREIVRIVRAEAYYFAPQRQTKIMNEGWASFWHSRILTRALLEAHEIVDFADTHSGATAASPGQLNPYKMGIELFRHAEKKGLDLFRLRAIHNDASFIDALVDDEFAEAQRMFVYGRNQRTGRIEIVDRDWRKVKSQLLTGLSWGGLPQIELVDSDYEGRGELLLKHHHDGRDLQLDSSGQTLRQLAELWGKPVHLYTLEEGHGRKLTSDGEEVQLLDTAAATAEEKPAEGDEADEGQRAAS